MRDWKVFVFDFDGVLVDSYTCLPSIYKHIARLVGLRGQDVKIFVRRAIKYEDEQDAISNYDRMSWWPSLFKEFNISLSSVNIEKLLREFHELRARLATVFEGVDDVLKLLREKAFNLVILAGNDGQKSMKRKRIKASGLAQYFDEIIIIGEDIGSRISGVNLILKKFNVSENQLVLVEDKPKPINEVKENFKGISTIKVDFESILKLAWRKEACIPDFRITAINELKELVGP